LKKSYEKIIFQTEAFLEYSDWAINDIKKYSRIGKLIKEAIILKIFRYKIFCKLNFLRFVIILKYHVFLGSIIKLKL
jgi:hypothetical protein